MGVYNRQTMKWIIPFLAVVCGTLAMPRKERAFSLFSVVTFPNNECTTMETLNTVGVCKTAEECGESSGTKSGNCASGFGVCCFHTVSAAGEITNNLTYIQNTGYPSTTGTTAATVSAATAFTVKGGSSVCQVRLDFDDVELIQPATATGICTATTADQLTIASPSTTITGVDDLCGTLTGSHLYIHNDGADTAATITITLGSSVATGRKWKIKVTIIECDCPSLAPAGCLQYYTGATGTITSFNGGSTTNQMIQTQEYSACIRTEAGMCSFSVTQTRITATPDAFDLSDAATATAVVGACAAEQSWLVIPNTGVAVLTYCGGLLASAIGSTSATAVLCNFSNMQYF